MGLRDLRAGTTAVIGDCCPASEIDILIADITESISTKLAEGSNIESTIVQALQSILADSHNNVKNLFGDTSSFGATATGEDPSTPRSDHHDESVDLGSITKAEQDSLLECMQSPPGTNMAGRAAEIMAEITRRQCEERDVARAVRLSVAADERMEPEPEPAPDGAEEAGADIADEGKAPRILGLQSPFAAAVITAMRSDFVTNKSDVKQRIITSIRSEFINLLTGVMTLMEPLVRAHNQDSVGDISISSTAHRQILDASATQYGQHVFDLNTIIDQKMKMVSIHTELTSLLQAYTAQYSILAADVTYLLKERLRPGKTNDNVDRPAHCGWGAATDEDVTRLNAELTEAIANKDAVKIDMASNASDIAHQMTCIKSFGQSVKDISSKYMQCGSTSEGKEKTLSEVDLKKYMGDLTPELLESMDSPLTAKLVIKMVQGIIASYPMALAPLLPALNRIFSESITGKLKVKPFSILAEQRNPGGEPTEMSAAVVAEYIKSSGALYNILSREFDGALRKTHRPYRICGAPDDSKTVQSVEGDPCMSLYVILDSSEKYGWEERNSLREFFTHGHVLMATESCISRAFTLLRKPLAKALHMGVTLDYAAFKAILISITRREPAILGEAARPYMKLNRDPQSDGYEDNLLPQLDEVMAVMESKISEFSINDTKTITTGIHHAESVATFQAHAVAVLGKGWERNTGGGSEKAAVVTAGYESLMCGSKTCNKYIKPGSFAFRSCVKYLIDKKLPVGSPIKTLCNECFASIKDKSVGSIETGQGKMILFTMDNGSTRVQLQGKGSANRSQGQTIVDDKKQASDGEDSKIESTKVHRAAMTVPDDMSPEEITAIFAKLPAGQFQRFKNSIDGLCDEYGM